MPCWELLWALEPPPPAPGPPPPSLLLLQCWLALLKAPGEPMGSCSGPSPSEQRQSSLARWVPVQAHQSQCWIFHQEAPAPCCCSCPRSRRRALWWWTWWCCCQEGGLPVTAPQLDDRPAAISSKLGPADWMTHSTCTSLFIITSNES